MPNLRRRDLFKGAVATAAYLALPSTLRGATPLSRLRTAHIGVGGMGGADLASVASHPGVEVAALCDVDDNALQAAIGRHPRALAWRDYRELLARLGDSIDAVVVSTPDHTHAPAAMAALALGKPVYCQKPLTHSVHEARALTRAAAARDVPTQMGIQIQSTAAYRQAVAIVREGLLGKVSRVYTWSNKNWGYDGAPAEWPDKLPEHLDWDLWLGAAPVRPFVKGRFHPGGWRRYLDYGTGTLGDMGVHIFDTPFGALGLGAPRTVTTTCREPTGLGHPERCRVDYVFPGTAHTTPELRWTWVDGDLAPPSHEELGLSTDIALPGQGAFLVGEQGSMLLPHIAAARLYPEQAFAGMTLPEASEGNHYHAWVDACRDGGSTSAGFDYGGPLTEALLLGVVAARFPGKTLAWDAEALEFSGLPEANALLRKSYREGFGVDGL